MLSEISSKPMSPSRVAMFPHRMLSAVVLLTISHAALAAPPTVASLFPSGARRGTTTEVMVGGTFERWPVKG